MSAERNTTARPHSRNQSSQLISVTLVTTSNNICNFLINETMLITKCVVALVTIATVVET